MEVKKSQKASLENKRLLFVEIGFVLALLAVLFAFEWSSKEKADSVVYFDLQSLPDTGDEVKTLTLKWKNSEGKLVERAFPFRSRRSVFSLAATSPASTL